MLTFFRWGIRIATGMVVLVSLLVLLVYWFASRSLPDYNRDVAVSGIGAPVEIVRDNANVPHIFGQSDADVFFGLGFAHAQDRLWQMVMLRRTLQGRLSEIFGPRTVEIDKLLRRYDLYTAAQQSVSAQDARTQEMLLAYSAGVNARITQVAEEALGRGAP
ncbi:MAG: penicillin acylase family protein, partial [Rhodobacteraceae bacterium]|nr:penicillin acylase family protein [Paracoccaceae bacterium]